MKHQPKTNKSPLYPDLFPLPQAGRTSEVAAGLRWARFNLPFALDHVNVWLLDGGADGWTVVDTGFNDEPTRAQWDSVFETTIGTRPVEKIFMTHFHPDHFGLTGWLHQKTQAPVFMTPGEWQMVQHLTDDDSAGRLEQIYRPHYRHAGLGEDMLEKLMTRRTGYRSVISPPPPQTEAVHPDDTVTLAGRRWDIIGGYGHSPEHASLYCADDALFIAGDMVLPFITPNISYFPGHPPGHDPLALYMDTLARIRVQVPDDVLVLPSHGIPFRGLHARIAAIQAHHEERLQRLAAILADRPLTAYGAMQQLFAHRSLNTGDIFFALGETLAHLIYDVRRGKIVETLAENKILYHRAA